MRKEGFMKVDLSEKEYRVLLDILYIAEWVLTACKVERDPRVEKYEEIVQRFYSLAEEMGCEKLMEFDDHLGKFFPTRKYEDSSKSMMFVEEFEEDTFWDELVHRLSYRDVINHVGGIAKLKELPLQKQFELEAPFEQKYYEEFEKNGLNNLIIEGKENHNLSQYVD
jgi:flagellar motor component MotA